jgi:DNA invertase Pin-like site-specific DNA recombinase
MMIRFTGCARHWHPYGHGSCAQPELSGCDAQYDASQAYIRSQAHAGWSLLRAKYDDGGFSGGNTDRPALQRLLEDVRAGRVDVIVVYKVDRLTRSLADFAKLVELFDRHKVSFVSVTYAHARPPPRTMKRRRRRGDAASN